MEKIKWHIWKWFGDRLEFCQAPNRSLPCVVDAANLLASQVAQLLNVAENKESMHTLRDESDCQLDESCPKGNSAALRMNELVQGTCTYHVAHTLCQEVLQMKLLSGLLLLPMFLRLRSQSRCPTCCTISLHCSCKIMCLLQLLQFSSTPLTHKLRPQVQAVIAGRLAATLASPSTESPSFQLQGWC